MTARRWFVVVMTTIALGVQGCGSDAKPARPLPERVHVRSSPEGVSLADPAFVALPGARAEFGRLGGAVYQIEVPDHWNGRLVVWMHGYEELRSTANTGPPTFRHYLITHRYAWAASSFSTTALIPGRAADETAALWDYFVHTHRRPVHTYVAGVSMGGWATAIAAERYADRYDGALALCGAAGTTPGVRISAEFFVAAAYAAGVTQREFDTAPTTDELIDGRILPALADPTRRAHFEQLGVALTGGPRAFDTEGFALQEQTNWQRARLLLDLRLVPPRQGPYVLAPGAGVTSAQFNRDAVRLPPESRLGLEMWKGTEVTGKLQMPMLTMHTTGDGQVPIDQAVILRRRVAAAGKSALLVQRVVRDPNHCGFSAPEQEAGFQALVDWIERGVRPAGTDLGTRDLGHLNRTFEVGRNAPAPAALGSDATIRGLATLDGVPLNARFIGAVVLGDGLATPCQSDIPPVQNGQFTITVFAQGHSTGCGRPGAQVVFWTYVGSQRLFAQTPLAWPVGASATATVTFSTAAPQGAAPTLRDLFGEVFDPSGRRLPAGTAVEGYVAGTLCGVASTRAGNFAGYTLSIVGPDAKPGCRTDAPVTFRVDGRPATPSRDSSIESQDPVDLVVR